MKKIWYFLLFLFTPKLLINAVGFNQNCAGFQKCDNGLRCDKPVEYKNKPEKWKCKKAEGAACHTHDDCGYGRTCKKNKQNKKVCHCKEHYKKCSSASECCDAYNICRKRRAASDEYKKCLAEYEA